MLSNAKSIKQRAAVMVTMLLILSYSLMLANESWAIPDFVKGLVAGLSIAGSLYTLLKINKLRK